MPDWCGDFNIRIDKDALWHYEGSPIGRVELCRLFSRVLHKDSSGDYWLITPAERGRIRVDLTPFVIIDHEWRIEDGEKCCVFRTNLGEQFPCNAAHPLKMVPGSSSGEFYPVVWTRNGLEARILRPVFYRLALEASEQNGYFVLRTGGQSFRLARV